MKLNRILSLLLIVTIVSCGSYEQVITDDGKIYEVKGNKIKSNGNDITETLSYEKRAEIKQLVADKKVAQKEAERLQKDLEEKKERQEEIEAEAREQQKELEDKQKALEDKLEAKKKARENYIDLKKKYDKETKKFKKLKRKGELSPNDISSWDEKLKDLKVEVDKARAELEKFK